VLQELEPLHCREHVDGCGQADRRLEGVIDILQPVRLGQLPDAGGGGDAADAAGIDLELLHAAVQSQILGRSLCPRST
jgi:hypothetical protein